jgi:hypothetical protein
MNALDQQSRLMSEDYKTIASMLVSLLLSMIHAGSEEWAPPFEIVISGANDDPVAHLRVNADSSIRSLNRSHFKLQANFPITAMITDDKGNARELVSSPDNQRLQ